MKSLTVKEHGKTGICNSFTHIVPFSILNGYKLNGTRVDLDGSSFKLERDPSTILPADPLSNSSVKPVSDRWLSFRRLSFCFCVRCHLSYCFGCLCSMHDSMWWRQSNGGCEKSSSAEAA
uniref:Uncharacterized protein n=1 Tax=Ditylenchus dipsaci TaxID=166011 RepID=A0A915DYJ6_9BILA